MARKRKSKLPIMMIILLFILILGGGAFYLQTIQNNSDITTETRKISEDTTLTTTNTLNLQQYEISKDNGHKETSWIYHKILGSETEVKNLGNTYSSYFSRPTLNCETYYNEEEGYVTGIVCYEEFTQSNTYNIVRVISGYSYTDSIPSIFGDKNLEKREDFPYEVVTLYKHCQWKVNNPNTLFPGTSTYEDYTCWRKT